jgi:AcrR family transcriptional regulator
MSPPSQPSKRAKKPARKAGNGTDQRILETATQLFRERGYEGTSLGEIASRVGITAAGLYWHYSNKAEILFAALEAAQKELAELTALPSNDLTPPEQLAEFTRRHLLAQIDRVEYAELYAFGPAQLLKPLSAAQRRKLRAMERKHLDRLEEILRAGTAEGSFSVEHVAPVAFAIIGMCEYVIHWFKPDKTLSREQLADVYAGLALRMAGASGQA